MPEARTYPHGVTCWVDTAQPDVDAALQFYGGLFGWEFEEAAPPEAPVRYVIATLGGRDVAALTGPADAAGDLEHLRRGRRLRRGGRHAAGARAAPW